MDIIWEKLVSVVTVLLLVPPALHYGSLCKDRLSKKGQAQDTEEDESTITFGVHTGIKKPSLFIAVSLFMFGCVGVTMFLILMRDRAIEVPQSIPFMAERVNMPYWLATSMFAFLIGIIWSVSFLSLIDLGAALKPKDMEKAKKPFTKRVRFFWGQVIFVCVFIGVFAMDYFVEREVKEWRRKKKAEIEALEKERDAILKKLNTDDS